MHRDVDACRVQILFHARVYARHTVRAEPRIDDLRRARFELDLVFVALQLRNRLPGAARFQPLVFDEVAVRDVDMPLRGIVEDAIPLTLVTAVEAIELAGDFPILSRGGYVVRIT